MPNIATTRPFGRPAIMATLSCGSRTTVGTGHSSTATPVIHDRRGGEIAQGPKSLAALVDSCRQRRCALSCPECRPPDRLYLVKFLSELYIRGLNAFFSVTATRHRTLAGYVTEPRAAAFEANQSGFRGLLFATNVRELNEKQWEFFRYMVLEIVHSRMASNAVLATLNDPQYAQHAESYRSSLAKIGEEVQALRNRYFEAAVRTALGTPEFRREVELLEMQAKANNKTDAEIKQIVDNAVAEKRKATKRPAGLI